MRLSLKLACSQDWPFRRRVAWQPCTIEKNERPRECQLTESSSTLQHMIISACFTNYKDSSEGGIFCSHEKRPRYLNSYNINKKNNYRQNIESSNEKPIP